MLSLGGLYGRRERKEKKKEMKTIIPTCLLALRNNKNYNMWCGPNIVLALLNFFCFYFIWLNPRSNCGE